MTGKLALAIAMHATLLCPAIVPASEGGSGAMSARLGGLQLRLEEREAVCFITRSNRGGKERVYSLDMPFPCAFHRDPSGDVRVIRNGKHVYALVESVKHVGGSADCETYLRSVRIVNAELQISEHKDKVASCPPFQWDRIMFTELFD
jgi:hypothetical protein